MTEPTGSIELRVVSELDRARLSAWLHKPSVADWWGGMASAEARFRLAAVTDSAIRRLVTVDGLPIGYGHAFDAAADQSAPAGLPSGFWLCDLFIGEEAYRGRGYWSLALAQLVAEVHATTLATGCALIIPVRNERVARAAERIGFRWTEILRDATPEPAWVMLREHSNSAR